MSVTEYSTVQTKSDVRKLLCRKTPMIRVADTDDLFIRTIQAGVMFLLEQGHTLCITVDEESDIGFVEIDTDAGENPFYPYPAEDG